MTDQLKRANPEYLVFSADRRGACRPARRAAGTAAVGGKQRCAGGLLRRAS